MSDTRRGPKMNDKSNDIHAPCRAALALSWSSVLHLLMEQQVEGVPLLELVLAHNPETANALRRALAQ